MEINYSRKTEKARMYGHVRTGAIGEWQAVEYEYSEYHTRTLILVFALQYTTFFSNVPFLGLYYLVLTWLPFAPTRFIPSFGLYSFVFTWLPCAD
jgi:hypothetical protein